MPASVFQRYEDLCDGPVMLSELVLNLLIGDGLIEKYGIMEPILRCETTFMVMNNLMYDITEPSSLLVNPNADIQNSNRVFVPVYIDADKHFVLYVVNKEKKEISYFDSLRIGRIRGGMPMVKAVTQLISFVTGTDISKYKLTQAECSQQRNVFDCGIFVTEFIRRIFANESPILDDLNMLNVRLAWFNYLVTTRDKNGNKLNAPVNEWTVPTENASMNYERRFEIQLKRTEMNCLKGTNLLTGLVIDNFLKATICRYSLEGRVIYVPSIVLPAGPLMMQRPTVRKLVEGIDENWEKALAPVNVNNNHWVLAEFRRGKLADGSDGKILVYDPLKKDLSATTLERLNNVREFLLRMPRTEIDEKSTRSRINTQTDGHSCGVRVCFTAERICKKLKHPEEEIRMLVDLFRADVYRGHIYNTLELYYKIVENGSGADVSTSRNAAGPSRPVNPPIQRQNDEINVSVQSLEKEKETDLNVSFVRSDLDAFNLFDSPKPTKRTSLSREIIPVKIPKIELSKHLEEIRNAVGIKKRKDEEMSIGSLESSRCSVTTTSSANELKNARERYRRTLKHLSEEERKVKMDEWNEKNSKKRNLDDIERMSTASTKSLTDAQKEHNRARERYRYSLRNLSKEERQLKMDEWNKEHKAEVKKEPKRERTELYKEYDKLLHNVSRLTDVDDDEKESLRKELLLEVREKTFQGKKQKLPRAAVCHELPEPHKLKDMIVCEICGALKFQEETRKTICCNGGKVIVDDFDTRTPNCMKPFRNRDHAMYKKRKEVLRMYNSMLCFATASFKPREKMPRGGPPVFVIQGEMAFNLCHLLPGTSKTPMFSQLYVVDDGEAAKALKEALDAKNTENKCFDDLKYLFKVIKENHVAAQSLSTMYEKYLEAVKMYQPQGKRFQVIMSLKSRRDVPKALEDKDVHPGRLNVPVASNQVASIYMSETGAVDFKELDKGTWIFDHHTGKTSQIKYFDENRFALAFPLLLPDGRQTVGYGKQYPLRNVEEKKKKGNSKDEEDEDELVVIDDEEDEKMKEFEAEQKKRQFASRAEFFRFVMNYFPNEREKKKYEEYKLKAKENPNYDPYEALRDCTGDHWLWGTNRLSQAAVIDMFQTTDAERMEYFEKHFTEYRSERQSVLWNIVQKHLPVGEKLGKVIHLPKAYQGSRENCHAKFQDGLAIAAAEGKPDLFITMTGNPDWPEVRRLIPEKDDAFDHIALVDRVFLLKLDELLNDLMKKNIFGKAKAVTLSIEFQKRGVPHAHILLTLEEHITTAEQVKNFICAEIPDKPEKDDPKFEVKQRLYELVKKTMIHGPCEGRTDLSCRETDESGYSYCSKHYPMKYTDDVYIADDRVEYQRRDDGKLIDFKNGKVATNRDVVPHNPYLLSKYGCHINVEVCISPLALAYIYKYVFKGHDRMYVEFKTVIQGEINVGERQPGEEPEFCYDERSELKSMRYLSAHEASYRIYGFPLAKSSHIVRRVPVHLPGDKRMVFKPNQDAASILANEKKSFQESYFELMKNDPSARHLSVLDVMKEYLLAKGQFKKRQRKPCKPMVIRLNPVMPSDMERYALRTLLIHTPGATGYDDLKTVTVDDQRTVYETFLEAAKARMLIDDQGEWDACLTEAAHFKLPKQMRYLFAVILGQCAPTNAKELWEKHKPNMISPNPKGKRGAKSVEQREKKALAQIEKYLRQLGHSLTDFGFDPIDESFLVQLDAKEAVADTTDQALKMEQYLNEQQREFSEMILKALKTPRSPKGKRCFFLQGSGGVGKTFTYNYLINKVTSLGLKVAACATTGIAATLLARVNATTGWTGHSFFKLPLEMKDGRLTSSLSATGTRVEEQRTQNLDLLIIDEAPMMRKEYYEGIEAYLRDIAKPEDRRLPFGGVVVILGGDFKQFMPVERAGHFSNDRAMRNTLIYSKLWKEFTRFELTQNVRVDKDQTEFADWLKKVGTGELNLPDETIKVPERIYMDNEDQIIQWIYPPEIRSNPREMGKRALVAVRNEDVRTLNEKVMDLLPGNYKDLWSVDTVQNHDEEGIDAMPVTEEFLHTLTPSGMPPHRLRLKVGMTVMLIRNMDVRCGLCNGVRLELLSMNTFMLHCRHVTDAGNGDCMIPRFKFKSNENNNAVKFTRLQFPVVPAQCLTVNKSQGATLDRVGLVLRHAAFAHGTNYVAFSRVRNWDSVKVTTNKNYPMLGDGTRDIRIANPVAKDLLELAAVDPSEVDKYI